MTTHRIATVTNHAAVKRFILDTIKTNRPGLGINRVAGETFDHYDATVESMIRLVSFDLAHNPRLPEFQPKERLLAWSIVREKLTRLWQDRTCWLEIKGVKDYILRHLEDRLRAKIRSDVHSHPSIGKTFKP